MSPAISSSMSIVAYLALFSSVGIVFLFVNLLVGKLVRPHDPHAEKLEIYECGEPTIGSSFVQFDLRFYVVALVFIVFDVEVAFLFPIATVFGKANHLADARMDILDKTAPEATLTTDANLLFQELGVHQPTLAGMTDPEQEIRIGARTLAKFTAAAIGLFFFILVAGFAYEWKTGSLDWVRAMQEKHESRPPPGPSKSLEEEPVLSA